MSSAHHTSHQHDPRKAIILRLASIALFTLMAALIKLCEQTYSTSQIVFFRSFFALFPLLPLLYWSGLTVLKTKRPLGHLGRGVIGLLAMLVSFYALPRLPLATYTTITFTMPLFAALLAVLWLRERMRFGQALALLFGFAGVLVVLRPDLGGASVPVLVALLAAALVAVVTIVIRQLTATENSLSIVFWFTLFCSLVSAVLMLPGFVMPSTHDLALLIGSGLTGGIAQVWLTQSYRYASVSLLGGLEYTGLIWATLLGFLFWHELPDLITLFGAAIIIISGFYLIRHASRAQQRAVIKTSSQAS